MIFLPNSRENCACIIIYKSKYYLIKLITIFIKEYDGSNSPYVNDLIVELLAYVLTTQTQKTQAEEFTKLNELLEEHELKLAQESETAMIHNMSD